MAAITNARMSIAPDDYARTTSVRVTCEIAYGREELAIIREQAGPVHFTLFCWLVGKDRAPAGLGFFNRQDWLYWFQSQPLPQGGPEAVEPVAFEAVVGHALLNEDVVGKDEIAARLLLRGWRSFRGTEVTVETNTVQYEFGS